MKGSFRYRKMIKRSTKELAYKQVRTQQDVIDALKRYGIKYYSISHSFHDLSIHIVFYSVHWYSFIRKNKIARIKLFFKDHGPATVFWDYRVTKNKIGNDYA